MPRPTLAAGGAPVSALAKRGGGRRVADPDLADDEAVDAAFGELRGQAGTGVQRGIDLRSGKGRPREHVGGPVGDLGVAHTGRGGADQADVGDQHVVSALRASTPTALSPRAAAAVTCAQTSASNRLVPWTV